MAVAGDALYSNNLLFLTLTGRITVYFIDGQTLQGDFAAQDIFNIFLTVDDEPVMIPRSQIRYIRGERGQRITEDTSHERWLAAKPVYVDTVERNLAEPKEADEVLKAASPVENQVVLAVDTAASASKLSPPAESFPTAAPPPPIDEAVPTSVEDEDENDGGTIILEEISEVSLPSEPAVSMTELDDDTFVIPQSEAAEEGFAHLVCTAGPHNGEIFKLTPGVITIGRSSDNMLAFPKDKEMSRRHALITYEAGRFVIQDQNSLNGTLINDQPIKGSTPLKEGDVILLGVSILKYEGK